MSERKDELSDRQYWIGVGLGIVSGFIVLTLGAYAASMYWAPVEPSWSWAYIVGLGTMVSLNKMLDVVGPHLERWLA